MSTRAVYSFTDADGTFHVYVHHDGYPEGAVEKIRAAIPLAWPMPRFEADEFAAAFVAGNKTSYGSVRLMPTGAFEAVSQTDVEYRYTVTAVKGAIRVVAEGVSERDGKWTYTPVFDGTLAAMAEKYPVPAGA